MSAARLVALALLGSAAAFAQPATRMPQALPVQGAPDAGHNEAKAASSLSPEDQEVVENLELLENLEQSNDLDLLEELSKED